jgi:hypothetical protein
MSAASSIVAKGGMKNEKLGIGLGAQHAQSWILTFAVV